MLTKKEKQIILDAFESIYEDELNEIGGYIPCPFEKTDNFRRCEFCKKLFPRSKADCPVEDLQINSDSPYDRWDLLFKTERLIKSLRLQLWKERQKENIKAFSELLKTPDRIINRIYAININGKIGTITVIQKVGSIFVAYLNLPALNISKPFALTRKKLLSLLKHVVDDVTNIAYNPVI